MTNELDWLFAWNVQIFYFVILSFNYFSSYWAGFNSSLVVDCVNVDVCLCWCHRGFDAAWIISFFYTSATSRGIVLF